MDQFKKFENQLISSYETGLAVEGEKICKEVDSILEDNDELLVEKAYSFLSIFNTGRNYWFIFTFFNILLRSN